MPKNWKLEHRYLDRHLTLNFHVSKCRLIRSANILCKSSAKKAFQESLLFQQDIQHSSISFPNILVFWAFIKYLALIFTNPFWGWGLHFLPCLYSIFIFPLGVQSFGRSSLICVWENDVWSCCQSSGWLWNPDNTELIAAERCCLHKCQSHSAPLVGPGQLWKLNWSQWVN